MAYRAITKVKSGYRLRGKRTGKNLGTYKTKAAAKKAYARVGMFVHMKSRRRAK